MTIFRVNDKAVEICNDTLTNTFANCKTCLTASSIGVIDLISIVSILSSTLSHKGYYVVSFERSTRTAETVIALEPLLKFVVVEVGGEVGKLAVLRPNLVASVQELIGEETCVHAEESAVLYADVVEAHVLWVALETTALFLVVGETIEVVVNGVVIDHLRDRQVPEETRVVGALEILAEDLHEERLAHTDTALYEDALVQLVATTGKTSSAKGQLLK